MCCPNVRDFPRLSKMPNRIKITGLVSLMAATCATQHRISLSAAHLKEQVPHSRVADDQVEWHWLNDAAGSGRRRERRTWSPVPPFAAGSMCLGSEHAGLKRCMLYVHMAIECVLMVPHMRHVCVKQHDALAETLEAQQRRTQSGTLHAQRTSLQPAW